MFTHSTLSHLNINVGTSSTPCVAANQNRRYILWVNISDTVIWLSKGSAIAKRGIRLEPNGGAYEMAQVYGNMDTAAFSAIHEGAGEKELLITVGDDF